MFTGMALHLNQAAQQGQVMPLESSLLATQPTFILGAGG